MASEQYLDQVGEQILLSLMPRKKNHLLPTFQTIDELGCSLGTHLGNRRIRNEDRTVVSRIEIGQQACYTIALICDGVGGSERGDEAAAIACATAISFIARQTNYISPKDLLTNIVRAADDTVRNRLKGEGFTTLTAVLVSNRQETAITSIGDSRAYSWEPSSDLIQLIEDDTLENELKQLNIAGKSFLKERGLQGSLSQALGELGRESKDLRIIVLGNQNIPPGGILLGSDGLWRANQDAFERIAQNSITSNELVRRSITAASWLGGIDNSSAVAIDDLKAFAAASPKAQPDSVTTTIWTSSEKVVFFKDLHVTEPGSKINYSSEPNQAPKTDKSAIKKRRSKKIKSTVSEQLPLNEPDKGTSQKKREIVAGPDED
ncbi:PP2C family protein-serine/threonine phosphatase [Lysobacter capsici]|uniref:PP2C family protein-serine/threonine phosphatase n=1 Tax=Lysobacter capsici TaxID=435897 RepID=UPI0009E26591|nr:protein phosphatase 2C domain-containing protein [Lysobacter capsici]